MIESTTVLIDAVAEAVTGITQINTAVNLNSGNMNFSLLSGGIALIIIIIIIERLSAVNKKVDKLISAAAPKAPSALAAAVISAPTAEADDSELVAVFAAAIAASTGKSASEFRVVAFRRTEYGK